MNWTSLWQGVIMGVILFGIGYLIPVKSPFDKDCPEIIPVSTTTTHDSSNVDPNSLTVTGTNEDIKPTTGWYYTSITQDTIDGKPVDIIEKEKYWSYVDSLRYEDSNYVVLSRPEVIITGLVDDTITVDIIQNIEVDPKPYYIPIDTVYIITTVEVPVKPEPTTVWQSPVFWGAIGVIIGGLFSGIINRNNLNVVNDFNDLRERD